MNVYNLVGCRYLTTLELREFKTKCGHLIVQDWGVDYVLVDFYDEVFIVRYASTNVFETILSFDTVFGCGFIWV